MPASLFISRRITPTGEYTFQIEGPAVDRSGNLYVCNLKPGHTIGKVAPGATHSTLFTVLPDGGKGSGIRFDREGRMYIAAFNRKSVLVIAPGHTDAQTYFTSTHFNQPNDLAIAGNGTLYASDPNFGAHKGQIWKIVRNADGSAHGEVMVSNRQMAQTNGIDLSPDEKTLYVSESDTRQVWAYRIDGNTLTAPQQPLATFQDGELDGMRTDITGRLYITRNGAREIAIINPDGSLAHKVSTVGQHPCNLTFGGSDGKTVFVTQADGCFVESFLTDQPGREFVTTHGP